MSCRVAVVWYFPTYSQVAGGYLSAHRCTVFGLLCAHQLHTIVSVIDLLSRERYFLFKRNTNICHVQNGPSLFRFVNLFIFYWICKISLNIIPQYVPASTQWCLAMRLLGEDHRCVSMLYLHPQAYNANCIAHGPYRRACLWLP